MKPHSGNKYRVAGAMSGTSLDGLDLAVVEFIRNDATWQFNLLASETTLYSDSWHHKLSSAPEMNGENLLLLHNEYGSYVGSRILSFLKNTG